MKVLEKSRILRAESTKVEQLLWLHLRNRNLRNLKFKRQFPVGQYIVDFICIGKRLIIELDGSQHLENILYDIERTENLNSRGYKVTRFWNNDVIQNLNGVLEQILIEAEK